MTLLCLIGPSCSGKTTLAEALVPTGIDTIRSYTTRPMRPGEKQGREHIFIDEQDAIRLLTTRRPLAYTLFGGYRYFALWEQVGLSPMSADSALPSISRGSTEDTAPTPTPDTHRLITYVIDEAGYHSLITRSIELQYELRDRYRIDIEDITLLPIRIERSEADITDTIDPARRARDIDRPDPGTIPYRITIHNDAPSVYQLTQWAQTQLAPALRIWLNSTPEHTDFAHLTTQMGIAQIIAHLNGAI